MHKADQLPFRGRTPVLVTLLASAVLAGAPPPVATSPAAAQEPARTGRVEDGKSIFDTRVELLRFDSGLRVVLAAVPAPVVPDSPRVFVGLYIDGYGHETEERQGEAHYLEHIVSNGSPKRRDYVVPEDLVVHNSNAATRDDYTSLWITVGAIPGAVDAMVASRLSRLRGIEITEELITTQKERLVRELRGMAGSTRFHADHLLRRALFGDSADIGYEIEVLRKFDLAETEGLVARHFTPGRAVLVVAGDIDLEETRAIVERRARGLAAQAPSPPGVAKPPSFPAAPVTAAMPGGEVSHAGLAFPLPPREGPDYLAHIVLDRLLMGGQPLPRARSMDELTRSLTSPLGRRLVASVGAHAVWDGESYGTSDPPLAGSTPGFYRIHVSTRRPVPPAEIARQVRETLHEIHRAELTDDAIERARRTTVTFYREWLSGPWYRSLGVHLAGLTMFDRGPDRLATLPSELLSVKPDRVRRVMREYLLATDPVIVLLAPPSPGGPP